MDSLFTRVILLNYNSLLLFKVTCTAKNIKPHEFCHTNKLIIAGDYLGKKKK